MIIFSLAFLMGDWILHQLADLPTHKTLCALIIILLLSFLFTQHYLRLFFIGIIMGYCYSALYAMWILNQKIPLSLEIKPVQVEGYIVSIPQQYSYGQSFLFQTEKINGATRLHPKILVYFKTNHKLLAGDKWRFVVKLKVIHSLQNEGGSDYEAYAYLNNIAAKGMVLTKYPHRKISNNHLIVPFTYLRQQLFDHLRSFLADLPYQHWMMALIMGERINVPKSDWEILRHTGTNHLFAIAGLHIGIIAGFVYFISMFSLKYCTVITKRMPLQKISALVSLAIGIIYAAIAGFSIPTQRAAAMLFAATIFFLRQKPYSLLSTLAFALITILVFDPRVILSESFWLSFITIAFICYCMSMRFAPKGVWWKYGRIQWIIGVGLMPISLFFFKECSLISFVANTIAIPWLAFLLLPWLLIAASLSFFSPIIANYLFILCHYSLAKLWHVLIFLNQLPFASINQAIVNHFILLTTTIAVIIFLLPRGIKGKSLFVIWLLPLFTFSPPKPKAAEVFLTVLDVGQALAVVVRTKHHVLLYDTGLSALSHNSGTDVIIPYLRNHQLNNIDLMLISHGDNDHLGGAASIFKIINVKKIETSDIKKINFAKSDLCLPRKWHWDGIDFTILYPTLTNLNLGNNSSCVLMIDAGRQRVLLTGDIEAYAENKLLELFLPLRADVIIAPHHGSKTSSTPNFIASVDPKYVIYSVGYHNRYHFPHKIITDRYGTIGAKQLATDKQGAITLKISNEKGIVIETVREKQRRFWHYKFL